MIDIRDHGGRFSGGKSLSKLIRIVCSLTEPANPAQNDVWLKVSPGTAVHIKNALPSSFTIGNVVMVKLSSKFVNKGTMKKGNDLFIDVDELDGTVPLNQPLLLDTESFSFYSTLSHVVKKVSDISWEGVEGYWYNNGYWIQFSRIMTKILVGNSKSNASEMALVDSINYTTIKQINSGTYDGDMYVDSWEKKIYRVVYGTKNINIYDFELNLLETWTLTQFPKTFSSSQTSICGAYFADKVIYLIEGYTVYKMDSVTGNVVAQRQVGSFRMSRQYHDKISKRLFIAYTGNGSPGALVYLPEDLSSATSVPDASGFWTQGFIKIPNQRQFYAILQKGSSFSMEYYLKLYDMDNMTLISSQQFTGIGATSDIRGWFYYPDGSLLISVPPNSNLRRYRPEDLSYVWDVAPGRLYTNNLVKGHFDIVYGYSSSTDSAYKGKMIKLTIDGSLSTVDDGIAIVDAISQAEILE